MTVNRPALLGLDRTTPVDRISEQVEDPPKGLLADGHRQRRSRVKHVHAADHAVGAAQGHAADTAATEVLLHFAGHLHRHPLDVGLDLQRVVDLRQLVFGKLGIKGRTDDLCHLADGLFGCRCHQVVSCVWFHAWLIVVG